ncbi:MAG: restriction endonuclease subunit S [Cyanobium sp.]
MKHLPFHEALEDCSRLAGKVPQASCLNEGEFPVIGQGKQKVEGFTNDSDLVFRGELPVILFGDHTAAFKFIDRPFARGADGTKLFRPRTQCLDAKFAWHFLQTAKLPETGYDRKTKYLESLRIPLPPLEEQRRIAAILDRAQDIKAKVSQRSSLLQALTRSLFVRRFGLPSENPRDLAVYKLVDICNPKQWPTISSKQLLGTGYPVFGANGLIGYFDRFNHPDPTVLATCRGATCGTVNISPPN